MASFSDREGFTTMQHLTDDAPLWLRNGFYNGVLQSFLYLDRSSNPFASPTDSIGSPIGAKFFIEKLSFRTKTDLPANYSNDGMSLQMLRSQLNALPWFHFYNAVELVGELLIAYDSDEINRSYGVRYFPQYRESTNKLLQEAIVGWQMDSSGKLRRTLPMEVNTLEQSISSMGLGTPVMVHVGKARAFINQHPCDSANAIKESVSALESLACILAPGTNTLSKATAKLRKTSTHPQLLLSAIDKLYEFASDEPAVRHGGVEEERVSRKHAEFVYVTSLAMIRYLQEAG